MAAALIGESFTPFDATRARLGIGTSSVPEDPSQTGLLAQLVRLPMQVGYPQRVGKVITFRVLAGAGVASGAWNEIGVFNAASGGTMLKRVVRELGTKPSGQIWALQIQLEVANEDL